MNSRNFRIKVKKLNVNHYICFRPWLPAARRLGRGLVRVRGAGAGVHCRHQLQHQVLWRRKAHNQNFEGLTPILLSSIRHKGTCVMKIRHSDSQFIFRSQEEGGWQPVLSFGWKVKRRKKTRFHEPFCHSGEFCSFIRRVQNLVANYLIRSLATIFTMSLHSVLAKLFRTAKSDTAFQAVTIGHCG